MFCNREYFLDVLSRRGPPPGSDPAELRRYRERRARGRRERKAARTLAVITGTFIVCWLPFFTVATVRPFCGALCSRAIPPAVVSLIAWLGYVNSLLNPLIYTVFNPDFRRAFRRILRLDSRTDAAVVRDSRAGGGGAGGSGVGPIVARSRSIERSQNESRPPGGAVKPSAVSD